MYQRLEPLDDFVLLEVPPPVPYHVQEGLTHIIVPERYEHGPKDRAVLGTVLKKGPACAEKLVAQGTSVVIPKWRGAYLNPAKTLLMVRESEILAIDA